MTTSEHDPARSARPELEPRDTPDALRPDLAPAGREPTSEVPDGGREAGGDVDGDVSRDVSGDISGDIDGPREESPRPRASGSP